MKLIIANKRFSSWSMRPWLALHAAGIPFEEVLIPFHDPDFHQKVGPTRKVPALLDGDLVVPESLAICEYAAELAPSLWPADRRARAHARAVCTEMHAGFANLRRECSMDLLRPHTAISLSPETQVDVLRVLAIWDDCLGRYGGPWLFGDQPTIADAMFAPVVGRFDTYGVDGGEGYRATVRGWPHFQRWLADAQLEREWPTTGH